MSGANYVYYNDLAHLRKLPTKLRIYDALILLKEIKNSLAKSLLDLVIFLAELNDTNQVEEEEEPTDIEGALGITFHDSSLLLGPTMDNRLVYITVDFGIF